MKPPELADVFTTAVILGTFVAIVASAAVWALREDAAKKTASGDAVAVLLTVLATAAVVTGIAIVWYQLRWADYHRSLPR